MTGPAEFDQFAGDYNERLERALSLSGETKEYFARARVEWLARCLRQLQHTARAVLDYGCGIGDTAVLLREILGAESVVGLDVSERSVERARRDYGSAGSFSLFAEYAPDASIDVVYCNGVFHHIAPGERAAAMRYVLRCLRPGGVFALWENNPWNPGTQWVMHRCEFDHDAVKIFPRQAKGLLAGGGLEILRTDYRFFFPRLLKQLRPLEDSLIRIPLGGQYQVLARKPLDVTGPSGNNSGR
jgi:SAM-dependent methyltransferase